MDEYLRKGIKIAKNKVDPKFGTTWKRVTDSDELPRYKIFIWGSTVQDKDRIPNDLDIIIEYTGHSIEPEQEKSIESIIKSEIYIKDFSRVYPVVKHRFETPDIIANSRFSQVYSVTEDSYFSY